MFGALKQIVGSMAGGLKEKVEKFANRDFLEAAVAGGIPIIKILTEGLAANRFHQGKPLPSMIRSTTSFICPRGCRHCGPNSLASRVMAPHCGGEVGADQRRALA